MWGGATCGYFATAELHVESYVSLLVRILFIAQQVNKGAVKPPAGRRMNRHERRENGGDLYREYRHDAVALRYNGIMLLLVRLIVATRHTTHLSHDARCHDFRRWSSAIIGLYTKLLTRVTTKSCHDSNFDVVRKPKARARNTCWNTGDICCKVQISKI